MTRNKMKQEILKYFVLVITYLILTNCTSSQKDCQAGKFYFPSPQLENAEIGLDTFLNDWYSSHLRTMNEPILTSENECEIIRVTYLGTWSNPEIYRVNKCKDEIIGYFKKTNGQGGYETGEIIDESNKTLSDHDWINISNQFSKLKSTRISNETNFGTDGSQWIIERRTLLKYEYIERWSIELKSNDKELYEYCRRIINLIK